jgi:hypothetical protein
MGMIATKDGKQAMLEGLYKVEFKTPLGAGSGVVFAREGKMWGGDAGLFYTGSYTESGADVIATVSTDRHTAYPGTTSVFGRDQVQIKLSGKMNGDSGVFQGSSPQAPGVGFTAALRKISN